MSTCFISFWEKTLKYPNITWIFPISLFIPIRFWFMYYTTLLFGSYILKIATCFCGLILLLLSNTFLNLIFSLLWGLPYLILICTLSEICFYWWMTSLRMYLYVFFHHFIFNLFMLLQRTWCKSCREHSGVCFLVSIHSSNLYILIYEFRPVKYNYNMFNLIIGMLTMAFNLI